MTDIKEKFQQAAADVQKLSRKPDNDTLLALYALYKQATSGDTGGKRPGMFDLVGQAKYDAWEKLKGTGSEAAMEKYIALVEKLKGIYV
jgi:acyl-CoA-binding protein